MEQYTVTKKKDTHINYAHTTKFCTKCIFCLYCQCCHIYTNTYVHVRIIISIHFSFLLSGKQTMLLHTTILHTIKSYKKKQDVRDNNNTLDFGQQMNIYYTDFIVKIVFAYTHTENIKE